MMIRAAKNTHLIICNQPNLAGEIGETGRSPYFTHSLVLLGRWLSFLHNLAFKWPGARAGERYFAAE